MATCCCCQTCENQGPYYTDQPNCTYGSSQITITTASGCTLDCWECDDCESGGASVSASSSGRTGLGVSVTNDKPYLTITSSGDIDLICADYWKDGEHFRNGGPCYPAQGMKCTRPNAPFTAPAHLRIYVGGVLLSDSSDFNGTTSLRGAVTANIRDSGYYDNCGGYSVGATVCA